MPSGHELIQGTTWQSLSRPGSVQFIASLLQNCAVISYKKVARLAKKVARPAPTGLLCMSSCGRGPELFPQPRVILAATEPGLKIRDNVLYPVPERI